MNPHNHYIVTMIGESLPQFFCEYPELCSIGARTVPQLNSPADACAGEIAVCEKGVADYELTRAQPEKLASSLPSIEDIEAELAQELKEEEGE